MMLTQLAQVARLTGYPVVEVPGWKTRTRPGGMISVKTVTCHHTANGGAKGNYPSLRVIRDGRSGLPGPLAQYGLGVDGTIYVIAAGKCNHAGVSKSTSYTNSYAIGIEAEAVGVPGTKSDWPEKQMDSYARLCAALIDEFNLSVSDVRGHKETASPSGRKIDPSFDMNKFRKRVANVDLRKTNPREDDDDMKLTDAVDLTPIAERMFGRKTATVRELLQWPPSVRAARDDIEAFKKAQMKENAALRKELRDELAKQKQVLDQILQKLTTCPPASTKE